ncbi:MULTISPECIES: type IV pilus biogenesis protein PilP [Gluconobacter]|uniref:Type IV pilus biogenesis protein PilP n=2 Tax=Gluconobacter oxydans TaxID=442 RepID=Q5HXR3_GLUOX|nr:MULTISPECIES: type IV pilus biogenesis protein PilP [Gluconobacter]AAW59690.1 hypothetical protein GOX2626 [Gluconobacter oxydans 621H]MBS1020021.1 type IV pilus biogenesis protein PilP [Gluconobacter cerinus]MBS1069539.1 type IV pilus biogenesis protein PilP [Gluconobacter cerinus]
MKRATHTRCCGAAILIFTMASAHAEVPDCATHLQRAAPGQVLTAEQIDLNNNCLQELQQESAAVELRARIADSEKKILGKTEPVPSPATRTSGGLPLPGFPTVLPPNAPTPVQPRTPTPPVWLPPRIAMIASDQGRMTASLKMPDGALYDAIKGTVLPDGSTVTAIRADIVYVRHGKDVVPLSNDDGSTQIGQAVASGVSGASAFPVLGTSGARQ